MRQSRGFQHRHVFETGGCQRSCKVGSKQGHRAQYSAPCWYALLTPGEFQRLSVIGFMEGTDVIFVRSHVDTDIYKVHLKSRQVVKLAPTSGVKVVPYTGFYIPTMKVASAGEEPREDSPST